MLESRVRTEDLIFKRVLTQIRQIRTVKSRLVCIFFSISKLVFSKRSFPPQF